MKKILAFAGSTSSTSINKQLATFAAENLENSSFDVIDLRDFKMPIYSTDEEKEGIPEDAKKFSSLLDNYDGFIVSLAEHNGVYTAAFKNLFDWMSVIDGKLWSDIPMLLLATSPGTRGGKSVLEIAKLRFPYMGGNIIESFSLPSFGDNFKENKIIEPNLNDVLKLKVKALESFLTK